MIPLCTFNSEVRSCCRPTSFHGLCLGISSWAFSSFPAWARIQTCTDTKMQMLAVLILPHTEAVWVGVDNNCELPVKQVLCTPEAVQEDLNEDPWSSTGFLCIPQAPVPAGLEQVGEWCYTPDWVHYSFPNGGKRTIIALLDTWKSIYTHAHTQLVLGAHECTQLTHYQTGKYKYTI